MSDMRSIGDAIASLEESAATGDCSQEAVDRLRQALQMQTWLKQVLEHLQVLRVGPSDVLTLRVPPEVIHDEGQMREVHAAARDIAEVARRGIVVLQEGAPLTAESLSTMIQPKPVIHVPRGRFDIPKNGR